MVASISHLISLETHYQFLLKTFEKVDNDFPIF